jgi:hypothetical protein
MEKVEDIITIVNTLENLHICPGNCEREFTDLAIKKTRSS